MYPKRSFKPGNMLYPLPAALISCGDLHGKNNLITVAWTGTICSDPAMIYISVRKERYSHDILKQNGEFVINLTTEDMVKAVDLSGIKSGKDVDKWQLTGLTPQKALAVKAPIVAESPLSIECKVTEVKELGSHDMFIANVVAVDADERYFDASDRFSLDKAGLIAYSHGGYFALGKKLGTFGFSVKK